MANTLMLIPARGGSRRLPGKALRCVGGLPLIARAIVVARRAAALLSTPATIAVSTDDPAIAEVARRFSAEIPFLRPAELAADDTPTIAVIRHALAHYASRNQTFTEVVLLQPTSPLRTAEDVVRTVRSHREKPAWSAVTVRVGRDGSPATQFCAREGLLLPFGAEGEPMVLNGAVYTFAPAWTDRHDSLALPHATRTVVMPAERSVDVDTADDLAIAQATWESGSPWPAGRCCVIAEAGVNHDGDLDVARRLVDAAVSAGADAVKFQTFDPARLASAGAAKAAYQQKTTPSKESQHEMLARLVLNSDDHRALQAHCRQAGIAFLSSAFDIADVDLLDALDVPTLKLGSGELTNHPLLAHAAATLRPVICSTGAAFLHEVASAVDVLRSAGCDRLALVHCVSDYPAQYRDLNLRAISTLAAAFDVPVGFSDHTLGIEAACATAALGARILEKHLTLDRNRRGPDHRSSLEPEEFRALVTAVRNVTAALGDGVKRPQASEQSVRAAARRSLVAACNITAGTVITVKHVVAKRPGTGIAPGELPLVLHRRAARDISADELINWDDLGPIGETT